MILFRSKLSGPSGFFSNSRQFRSLAQVRDAAPFWLSCLILSKQLFECTIANGSRIEYKSQFGCLESFTLY